MINVYKNYVFDGSGGQRMWSCVWVQATNMCDRVCTCMWSWPFCWALLTCQVSSSVVTREQPRRLHLVDEGTGVLNGYQWLPRLPRGCLAPALCWPEVTVPVIIFIFMLFLICIQCWISHTQCWFSLQHFQSVFLHSLFPPFLPTSPPCTLPCDLLFSPLHLSHPDVRTHPSKLNHRLLQLSNDVKSDQAVFHPWV